MAAKFGSTDPSKVRGTVFGTYSVQYNPEEFERIREDGFTVMGMVPDCRVFIYGTEITKDVLDVTVNNSTEGNSCDITLTNPRGRYEITKQDLMGKWREDKDILATYDYDYFKRVTPGLFDNFMDNITAAAFGKKTADDIKRGLNIARSTNSFLGGGGGGAPKVRGVTRQMFETKHFSGITKKIGDVVFDYKDPVYIFFKGRFAPLWYFGFTGIVVGWDDNDTYGQTQSIKLKCEDITSLWKRSKLTQRGAMFAFSRGQDRFKGTNTGQSTNPTQLAATFNFSDLIKVAIYSFNYGTQAYNCHISSPGRYAPPEGNNAISAAASPGAHFLGASSNYQKQLKKLQSEGFIDSRYMFTRARGGWGIGVDGKASFGNKTKRLSKQAGTVNSKKNSGLIPISEIGYLHKELFQNQAYKLNESPLGPSSPLYFQYNEITFPEKVSFTGANLKAMLDVSIRYWEAEHRISGSLPANADDITGTGWQDSKAFGIAGTHPALTYEFINNFSILSNIWQQCYKAKGGIDRVIMSPNDKIQSMIGGMPTELVSPRDLSKAKASPIGTAFNFFRPRLFAVLPRRFADRDRKAGNGTFAKFENLFKESATSVYEFLKEKTKSIEFIMYSSPCGDVFIEPELYDFHPLDFSEKIESKSIIVKDIPVKVRSYSGEQNRPATRRDKAYMFNSYANHPFFVMEKDRFRTTQTFNHKSIHTEITVKGGSVEGGGILEIIDDQSREAFTALASKRQSRGYSMDTAFANGVYVADGFQKNFEPTSAVAASRTEYEQARANLDKMVFIEMFTTSGSMIVINLVKEYAETMLNVPIDDEAYILFEEEAVRIQNLIKSSLNKGPGDALNTDDAFVVLEAEFPSLINVYTQKLTDVLDIQFNRYKNDRGADFRSTLRKSVLMEKLKVSSSTYISIMALMEEGEYDPKDKSYAVVRDMIRLGTPTTIDTENVRPLFDIALKAIKEYNIRGGSTILIRNIAEEKRAAQLGIYDPRYDMVKLYGYNPKSPIQNSFIVNGIEAYEYARTVFNRLQGKAFQIRTDVVGRPEFVLNRPYYCERKDSIGLLTKYSLRFQVGSDFRSSAVLEYVRSNSITFKYSLGDLDVFKSSANNNYFKKQADYYYKLNQFATNFSGRTSEALINSISGDNPGFGRALGARIAGNIASSVMGSMLPAGGIFSMHDRIGHIPFDTTFGEVLQTSKATTEGIPGATNKDNTIKGQSGAVLYDLAIRITKILSERKGNENKQTQYKELGDKVKKDIETSKKTITTKKNQLNSIPINATNISRRNTLVKEIRALERDNIKKQEEYNKQKTSNEKAKLAVLESNKQLYGVPEQLTGQISNLVVRAYDKALHKGTGTSNYEKGLFYKLFAEHMSMIPKLIINEWYIDEVKPVQFKFDFGDTPYYILRKKA